jgi:hypothetical protein
LNGFTNEDVDKKGYKFGLANTGSTIVTTTTAGSAIACLRISEPQGTTDDWAFTPCLNLKPGFTYTLSYYTRLSSDLPNNNPAVYFAGKVETKFGKAANSAGMLNPIGSVQTLTANGTYVQTTSTFTVTEDATYYLGFHVTNTDATKYTAVRIDDISLTGKSNACDITSFAIATPASNGTINGTSIAVTVPFGTSLSSLVSTFASSTNATVKVGQVTQLSGSTTNDFSQVVNYIVTAEDGVTTKSYTVTVTVLQAPKSTACDFTSFGILSPLTTGSVIGTTITVTVPTGTNVSNLIATFTTSLNATVKVGQTTQVSGTTSNNFLQALTYVVTAEDGTTTKTYTVNVVAAPAQSLSIWSSDFSNSGDWVISPNNTAGSLNWVLTSAKPTAAASPNFNQYWLSYIASFLSSSKGHFA